MASNLLETINSKKGLLTDIIDYSNDSIVSKTIAKNNGGSAVTFAFDKGQGLTEHRSPVDALVYIIEGSGLISISGVDHEMSAGEIIIMPANEPHAVKAVEKLKMLLIMLKIA